MIPTALLLGAVGANAAPPPVIPSLTWYGDGLTAGGSGTWSTAGSNWSDNGAAAGGWDPTKKAVFDRNRF